MNGTHFVEDLDTGELWVVKADKDGNYIGLYGPLYSDELTDNPAPDEFGVCEWDDSQDRHRFGVPHDNIRALKNGER